MNVTHLHLGTDHGGFNLKEDIFAWLSDTYPNLDLTDHGAHELDLDDDYSQYGLMVAEAIDEQKEVFDQNPTVMGVLLCRTGAGMAILANRFPGVRAVVCRNVADAQHARAHNNANVLVLEGDHVQASEAHEILKIFLQTEFEGGRHIRRIENFS